MTAMVSSKSYQSGCCFHFAVAGTSARTRILDIAVLAVSILICLISVIM